MDNKSEKKSHKKAIVIIVLAIAVAIIGTISVYRYNKIKLLDKAAYKSLYTDLEDQSVQFHSQEDMQKFITRWAYNNGLEYSVDESGNIIITREAVSNKKNVSPTVIVVSYNYENAGNNSKSLSCAALTAATQLSSSKLTVIFVNNEKNDGSGYLALDPALFTDNTKVIYLDYGKSTYISDRSFGREEQTVSVPFSTSEVYCDTAVRINISGVKSDVINTNISKKTTPVDYLSSILTRLRSKSTICQITDLSVGNMGNMYPDSMEVTVLVNSYSLNSFTKYLDGRIEKFSDTYDEEDYPDASFTYEVIDDPEQFPETAYSDETRDALTTLLYTINNDVYRFDEEDENIPEGYEVKEVYGINCANGIRVSDDSINVDISLQAVNDDYKALLTTDNANAAELSGCELSTVKSYDAYFNERTALAKTLKSTYIKVCDLSGIDISLDSDCDSYFTPMTYLSELNENMDMVHLKLAGETSRTLTNMLLCYIQTKGNFMSL